MLIIAGLVAVAAACGPTVGPATSSPSPAGSAEPAPRVTPWPGNSVRAINALGAADAEINKFLADFADAVGAEDVARMGRAADGLARMLEELMPNIDSLELYPPMRGLAAQYRTAFPAALDAAKRIRAAVDAGDGAAVQAATADLFEALGRYAELKPELADWVQRSLEQQRLPVR